MDDIQRKLELIDEQLAGGRNLHKRIVETCPFAFGAKTCAFDATNRFGEFLFS